jgi:HAD superfamily phosphatase (TIGR01681 family)
MHYLFIEQYYYQMKVLVFDFDGVLAITWTNPELHFPQIPALLKALSKKHILCVASYNPRAKIAIEAWDLHHHFTCIRAGANHHWEGEYDENVRADLCKSKQIVSMVDELKGLGHDIDDIMFFDDDTININVVNEKLPHVTTVLINKYKGIRMEDVSFLTSCVTTTKLRSRS